MFQTKNPVPAQARNDLLACLGPLLVDAADLQAQCKAAHWNVKGPGFYSLHKLFDDVNGDVEDYVDQLAERVVQLGGHAEAGPRVVAAASRLPPFAPRSVGPRDTCDALSTALARFDDLVRPEIARATNLGDLVTVELLTDVARGVEKWLWMVEAQLWVQG